MPKLSDTMSEGKILSWKKNEGDAVEPGEILAEIESDKANMEMEAYDAGYVRKLLIPEGGAAPVGAPIAILTEEPDEDIAEELGRLQSGVQAAPSGTPPAESPKPEPAERAPAASGSATKAPPAAPEGGVRPTGRVLASPLALRMAAEYGLDLSAIEGSGPRGRVVKRDIEQALAVRTGAKPPSAAPAPGPVPASAKAAAPQTQIEYEDVPISNMRKIIGARLSESKATAPHFYATMEVAMDAAVEARSRLNGFAGTAITFNDMVVKAVATALMRHPAVNASWQGDFLRYYRSADVGVAVSVPDGLITPVVRACHLKGLAKISEEVKTLAERAKQKKLAPEEYRGGTFTVTNLGMLGVSEFTGIINPPEACILAVGAVRSVPVVRDGAVVPGRQMKLTLSCDHRVVDGATAALFLKDIKEILENPLSLAL
jgi:pyruvate dehydrogenase E2 component (dihydrolipoamide acetyltransferase)